MAIPKNYGAQYPPLEDTGLVAQTEDAKADAVTAAGLVNAKLAQIDVAGSDAELQAQSLGPFTDSAGDDFGKGARGHAADALTEATSATASRIAAATSEDNTEAYYNAVAAAIEAGTALGVVTELPTANPFDNVAGDAQTAAVGDTVYDLATGAPYALQAIDGGVLDWGEPLADQRATTIHVQDRSGGLDVTWRGAVAGSAVDQTTAEANRAAILDAIDRVPVGDTVVIRDEIRIGKSSAGALLEIAKRVRLTGGGKLLVNGAQQFDQAVLVSADGVVWDGLGLDTSQIDGFAIGTARGEGLRVTGERCQVLGAHLTGSRGTVDNDSSNLLFVQGDDCTVERARLDNAGYGAIRHNGSERLTIRDTVLNDYRVKGYVFNGNASAHPGGGAGYGSVLVDGLHTDTDSTATAGAGFLIDPGSTLRMRLASLRNMNVAGYNAAAAAKIEYVDRVLMSGENRFVAEGSVFAMLVNYCGPWQVEHLRSEGFFAWNFGNESALFDRLVCDYEYDFNAQFGSGSTHIRTFEGYGGEDFGVQFRDLDEDGSTRLRIDDAHFEGSAAGADLLGIQFTGFEPGALSVGSLSYGGSSAGLTTPTGNTLYDPRIDRTPGTGRRTFYATGTDRLDGYYERGDVLENPRASETTVQSGGGGWVLSGVCVAAGYAYRYEWDSGTDYAIANPVLASDGSVYRAVAASGPSTAAQDPTTDDGTYWTELGAAGTFRVTDDVPLYAEAVWDPASITAGSAGSLQVALTGVGFGHRVWCSFEPDSGTLASTLTLSCRVESTSVVRVVLHNGSGGGADPGQGTVRVWARLSR